jgi:7-cyano-7-deazaguanine synthase
VSTVVAIVSGGIDSVSMLHDLVAQGERPHALSFRYGQRHAKELACAKWQCTVMGVPHVILDLSALSPLFDESALTNPEHAIPRVDYDATSLQSTVVPNRNMIMLSVALAQAIRAGADRVYYGAHGGDHELYPDCRPAFVAAMRQAAAVCHFTPLQICAPYEQWRKADIVKRGLQLGVEYAHTWSCYVGGDRPCGECSTCRERAAAFASNMVDDPLLES